jgi:hypothetical protein
MLEILKGTVAPEPIRPLPAQRILKNSQVLRSRKHLKFFKGIVSPETKFAYPPSGSLKFFRIGFPSKYSLKEQ